MINTWLCRELLKMERFSSKTVQDEIVRSTEYAIQDSVKVKEPFEDRLEVEVKYCDDKLTVLFYLGNPLDFLITDQSLMTMEYLDDKDPPDFSVVGVSDAVKWIISHVKENMMSKLEFYPSVTPLKDCIEDLQNDKVIDPGSYEISVKSDKVILIMRLSPESDYDIHNLMARSVKKQYYLLKLTFKTDNGHLIVSESKVHFSSSLVLAFPELNKIKLDERLQEMSISELIRSFKENVNAKLSEHYEAWTKRKVLLLSLQDIFANNGALVTVDLVRMSKLQIGSQLSSGNLVFEMCLDAAFPKSCPKIYFSWKENGDEQEEQEMLELTDFMTSNMSNDEIVGKTLDVVEGLVAKLNS